MKEQTEGNGLAYLKQELGSCTRCPLHAERTQLVFGEGSPTARLMFVGEAPGANEDRTGRPFVGDSGTLLTRALKRCGVERQDVYIANILKCRPPNNRDPLPDEISTCSPFLDAQILLIQPKVIVTLGRFAANYISGQTARKSMGWLSSHPLWYHSDKLPEIPVKALYHPSYIIRMGKASVALSTFMRGLQEAVALAGKEP